MIDPASVAALVTGFSDSSDGESLKSRDLVLMLLECTPAPVVQAVDGALGTPHAIGDLARAETNDVPEDDHLPLLVG